MNHEKEREILKKVKKTTQPILNIANKWTILEENGDFLLFNQIKN